MKLFDGKSGIGKFFVYGCLPLPRHNLHLQYRNRSTVVLQDFWNSGDAEFVGFLSDGSELIPVGNYSGATGAAQGHLAGPPPLAVIFQF